MASPESLPAALVASGTSMATVAVRRVDPTTRHSLVDLLDELGIRILPNTAGCFTASDAVLTAKLAREAFETDWVKLEVIGDDRTLLPDTVELVAAAEELVDDGFVVLPYCGDDPGRGPPPRAGRVRGGDAPRLPDRQRARASAIPTTSPSSSSSPGCRWCSTPGSAPHRMPAWPWSSAASAVLVASAVTRARRSRLMAGAMRDAVAAGRPARRAGRITRRFHAVASSATEGMVESVSPAGPARRWPSPSPGPTRAPGPGSRRTSRPWAPSGSSATTVVTAVTAQNTRPWPRGPPSCPPAMVEAQIATVLDDLPVRAVKTGLLGTPDIIEVVGRRAAAGRPAPTWWWTR